MMSPIPSFRPIPAHAQEALRGHRIPLELPPAGEQVEVPELEMRAFLPADAQVCFGGLGACCGLILRDMATGLTLVGHWPDPSGVNLPEVERFFLAASEVLDSTHKLNAIVAGIGVGEFRTADQAIDAKDQMITKIQELGVPVSRIEMQWARGGYGVDVEFDLKSGRVAKVRREEEE